MTAYPHTGGKTVDVVVGGPQTVAAAFQLYVAVRR